MLAAFVLFLREGLEASLIVSILFAALRQLGQMEKTRAVWIGVGLAILVSLIGGVAIYITIRSYDGSTFQTVFETITYLVAVVLLTTMTFWMQKHSRTLKREIITKAGLAGSGLALGLLAFSTVGREGLETAVFTLAFAFQTSGPLLLLGASLGLLASISLSFLVYKLGYRLDFRVFFRVMGILLLFFAAGLLGDAIQNMQHLGWLAFGNAPMWNTARILSENSTLGDILHTFLGYAEAPTILQGLFYVAYLLIVGGFFAWLTRKPVLPPPASSIKTSKSLFGNLPEAASIQGQNPISE
ncbi:MAG TPA: FTR1 family protein [Ktedonobacteraceae bacterium]|nr:FTR1 family protein [Ktedonobacteraceae bacterium]